VVDKDVVIFDPKEEEDPFHLHGQRQKFRDINKKVRKHLQFSFDHVFGPEDATLEVYSTSIHGMITHLLGGYNCTVFAYGATGAGKTHTMLGNTERPGVTPLLMSSLYAALDEVDSAEVDISVSYLEIYNETVNDLLVDQTSVKPLNLRKDGDSVIVSNLSWHRPATALELMAMLQLGNQRRT
jgi:kinesin family protein 18/19